MRKNQALVVAQVNLSLTQPKLEFCILRMFLQLKNWLTVQISSLGQPLICLRILYIKLSIFSVLFLSRGSMYNRIRYSKMERPSICWIIHVGHTFFVFLLHVEYYVMEERVYIYFLFGMRSCFTCLRYVFFILSAKLWILCKLTRYSLEVCWASLGSYLIKGWIPPGENLVRVDAWSTHCGL